MTSNSAGLVLRKRCLLTNLTSHPVITLQSLFCTVWNFQDFSVTYILREIKFGNFRRSKSAILATLENSPFFESVRNSQNLKILCHKKGQRDSL